MQRRALRWLGLGLLLASFGACHFHHHHGRGCWSPPVRFCR